MKRSERKTPRKITVKNKTLQCPVCGNATFFAREAQLNTSLATFFNLDWANRTASCYVCSECSHISWFLNR